MQRLRPLLTVGLTLAVITLATGSADAQSLNEFKELLGGNDSGLIPAKAVEPKLTITLTPQGPLEKGTIVTLFVKSELASDAYTYSQNPDFLGATNITVTEVFGLDALDDQFIPDHRPKVVFEKLFDQSVEKFPGGVTWSRRYRINGQAPADQISLAGKMTYQVCDSKNCRQLRKQFEVFPEENVSSSVIAATSNDDTSATMPSTPAGRPIVPPEDFVQPEKPTDPHAPNGVLAEQSVRESKSVAESSRSNEPLVFDLGSRDEEQSLWWILGSAFLGGLILNVMPCVLPVLAIKVMSFVQQAGESRGRALALNACYSIGVLSVFLVLAQLAISLRIGWGGLYQRPEFTLVMIGVVFAMGLSMLGVFEIPIPGMIGSAGGQHREGLIGAFLVGIFATLLSTPCSGPLMTTVLAWSVKQEASIVYLVWGVMGLGMASPFLVVGLVPGMAKLIPKPGMWMVRFKEFAGFALLATSLWLMNSLPSEVILPLMIILLGLAIGLWMVGTLYDHSTKPARKFQIRLTSLLVMGIIVWFGFAKYQEGDALAAEHRQAGKLSTATMEASLRGDSSTITDANAVDGTDTGHGENAEDAVSSELPWEPFSGDRLEQLLRAGKPVLVDFTADWCVICKQNESIALNTVQTAQFVREHGIITLYADATRVDPEIDAWLAKFGSISVPLTVIFPAGDPQHPIILDGPYFQDQLLSRLKQAVVKNVAAEERQSALLEQTSR